MPATHAAVTAEDIANSKKFGENVDNRVDAKVTIGANMKTVLRP